MSSPEETKTVSNEDQRNHITKETEQQEQKMKRRKFNMKRKKYHKANIPWSGLPTSYEPCVHLHFKKKTLSREELTQEEYSDMLATPKGYDWTNKPTKRMIRRRRRMYRRKIKFTHRCRKRKQCGKMYATELMSDMWDKFPPDLLDKVVALLKSECCMTEEEADTIIEKTKPRKMLRKLKKKHVTSIRNVWIRDFSKLCADKITDFIVTMLMRKRTSRAKRIAETILKHLCDLTGEECTLHSPKTRIQRLMVIFADRLAIWLDEMFEESTQDEVDGRSEKNLSDQKDARPDKDKPPKSTGPKTKQKPEEKTTPEDETSPEEKPEETKEDEQKSVPPRRKVQKPKQQTEQQESDEKDTTKPKAKPAPKKRPVEKSKDTPESETVTQEESEAEPSPIKETEEENETTPPRGEEKEEDEPIMKSEEEEKAKEENAEEENAEGEKAEGENAEGENAEGENAEEENGEEKTTPIEEDKISEKLEDSAEKIDEKEDSSTKLTAGVEHIEDDKIDIDGISEEKPTKTISDEDIIKCSPGTTFAVTRSEGSYLKVEKMSSFTIAEQVASARDAEVPKRGWIAPKIPEDSREWKEFITDISELANAWEEFLGSTVDKLTSKGEEYKHKKEIPTQEEKMEFEKLKQQLSKKYMEFRVEKNKIKKAVEKFDKNLKEGNLSEEKILSNAEKINTQD